MSALDVVAGNLLLVSLAALAAGARREGVRRAARRALRWTAVGTVALLLLPPALAAAGAPAASSRLVAVGEWALRAAPRALGHGGELVSRALGWDLAFAAGLFGTSTAALAGGFADAATTAGRVAALAAALVAVSAGGSAAAVRVSRHADGSASTMLAAAGLLLGVAGVDLTVLTLADATGLLHAAGLAVATCGAVGGAILAVRHSRRGRPGGSRS